MILDCAYIIVGMLPLQLRRLISKRFEANGVLCLSKVVAYYASTTSSHGMEDFIAKYGYKCTSIPPYGADGKNGELCIAVDDDNVVSVELGINGWTSIEILYLGFDMLPHFTELYFTLLSYSDACQDGGYHVENNKVLFTARGYSLAAYVSSIDTSSRYVAGA